MSGSCTKMMERHRCFILTFTLLCNAAKVLQFNLSYSPRNVHNTFVDNINIYIDFGKLFVC